MGLGGPKGLSSVPEDFCCLEESDTREDVGNLWLNREEVLVLVLHLAFPVERITFCCGGGSVEDIPLTEKIWICSCCGFATGIEDILKFTPR